jgi:hypothetical protein
LREKGSITALQAVDQVSIRARRSNPILSRREARKRAPCSFPEEQKESHWRPMQDFGGGVDGCAASFGSDARNRLFHPVIRLWICCG